MSEVTAPVTRYSERYDMSTKTSYIYTDVVTVSQSALRTAGFKPRALPTGLVEKARAAAQRNLGAEPEAEASGRQGGPPPPPPRRPIDRSFSEDDLERLVTLRVVEAERAGFMAQYPKAYRATVRARELAREAETPGWIRDSLAAAQRRSGGVW